MRVSLERIEKSNHANLQSFRVPTVYLTWANRVFLAFLSFNRINNLRALNIAFSSIPTAPGTGPFDGLYVRNCRRQL